MVLETQLMDSVTFEKRIKWAMLLFNKPVKKKWSLKVTAVGDKLGKGSQQT